MSLKQWLNAWQMLNSLPQEVLDSVIQATSLKLDQEEEVLVSLWDL